MICSTTGNMISSRLQGLGLSSCLRVPGELQREAIEVNQGK